MIQKEKHDQLVQDGSLPPSDFHDHIERIREVAKYNLEISKTLIDSLKSSIADYVIDQEKIEEIATAIMVGHVIFQGPPGTGKSSLARLISKAFNCSLVAVTAHEQWSTFELIGKQTLVIENGQQVIKPENGFFTESVILCANAIVRHFDEPTEPQATWLLIDELNRAHIDRAFGELFSLMGSPDAPSIILQHQYAGNRELKTPNRFRIIGTINSIDKQFVNSLSQAIRRRFTFITIDIPPKRSTGIDWLDKSDELAIREFRIVIENASQRNRKRFNDDRSLSSIDDIVKREGVVQQVKNLFDLAEAVRYSVKESQIPHLPIGTAQLIDVVELFLARLIVTDHAEYEDSMDWAASIKFAPSFEADSVSPSSISQFVNSLQKPFTTHFKRELLQIVAAGLYYVK